MTKKYYTFLIMVLMFLSLGVRAQNISLGFFGGASSRSLTNGGDIPGVVSHSHLVLAPTIGALVDLQFTSNFSLQPMLEYSGQGNKGGTFSTGAPTESSLPSANLNRAELDYALVPVLFKFGWTFENSPLRFYMAGGPFAGVLLSAQQTVYDNTPGNEQDVKAQLHQFNAGLEAKLGLAVNTDGGSFFIEGGGNYGLMNIQKNTNVSGSKTGSLMIDIGYSFLLESDSRRTSGIRM